MFIKSFLRDVHKIFFRFSKMDFFAQKKQRQKITLSFLFISLFRLSSSYPVTSSDEYNSKSSHNSTKIPPPLIFIISSLSHFQPFCFLFFSFFKPLLFRQAFSHIQPARDKELESSDRWVICHLVACPCRFIHHRSFSFRFSCILHLKPSVFFLSRLLTIFFFSNIGTIIICFATKIERHLCYSLIDHLTFTFQHFLAFFLSHLPNFFFHSFLLSFLLFVFVLWLL